MYQHTVDYRKGSKNEADQELQVQVRVCTCFRASPGLLQQLYLQAVQVLDRMHHLCSCVASLKQLHFTCMQGRKPPGARGSLVAAAGFSFGDFNAYDIGLYSEHSSSSSSSDTTQALLQPVPSLPGLSEPVTVQLGAQHATNSSALRLVKQQKATASALTTLSRTQHHAWRQGHASKPVGE